MTRKDFELIAKAMRLAREGADEGQNKGIDYASCEVASQLARQNARFDSSRFLAACGVEQ